MSEGDGREEEDLTCLSVCVTCTPSQARLMETQMWKRSSCSPLSGVIKKRGSVTQKGPREARRSAEESARLGEQRDPAAGLLQLVTARDFKRIGLIVEASLRPSVCVCV